MRKLGVTTAALVLGLSTGTAAAFEWNGFRSGMTAFEVRDTADAQGLTLDREPDEADNVTVPIYSADEGASRGFLTLCQGQLARVGTELRDLDVGYLARKVDQNATYGPAQVRSLTMETGARAVELSWTTETDQIGLVLVKLAGQQFMQETMSDIALWDLCSEAGVAFEEEAEDDFDSVDEERPPPTPEELMLDALGRALRGEGRDEDDR